MNSVSMIGRLTKDVEVRYTTGETSTAVAHFSVAVDRRGKDAGADFITCVAFGKTAEFIGKYFGKGSKIAITGHIHTGSYTDKSGNKVYTTDVVADNVEFCESKGQTTTPVTPQKQEKLSDEFMDVSGSDGLPFD